MAKKTISTSQSATQMVDDINSNFNELYQGAGGSSSSIDGLPTKRVKVYDVMTRAGNGVSAITVVPANIRKGVKYVVEKSERGSNWTYENIWIRGGSSTQTLLKTVGGTTSIGGYGVEIEATVDGTEFAIQSYNTGIVNIYHYEDTPTLGATRWLGKKWLVIGDSITTEHGGLAEYGYAELCSKSLGMQRENMAISGTTSVNWLQVTGAVSKAWSSYSLDYDLITVMLGTNDQGYNCPIGSLNDAEYAKGAENVGASYIARLQLLYEKLRSMYPKSVIAFITPIKRYDVTNARYQTNALGLTTEPYAQAVKTVCDYYSIQCIDIFNTIDPSTEEARTNFFVSSSDGTHPNALGHELFIAPIVEARLREIAPFYFNDWEE